MNREGIRMNENESVLELMEDSLDLQELKHAMDMELAQKMSELDVLKENREKIEDPESLGKVIQNIVEEQIKMQMGVLAGKEFKEENGGMTLDLRKDSHIQTTENFAKGKIATHNTEIDYQKRKDNQIANFQKDANGNVKIRYDHRSGESKEVLKKDARNKFDKDRPTGSGSKQMDHTVSAGEIMRDPAANAHLSQEEQIAFANSDKNLNLMDSAANQSKGDSKMEDWLKSERDGEKPADRFDIDENELKKKDKEAREEYDKQIKEGEKKSVEAGKKSQIKEAKRFGKKALKAAVMPIMLSFIRKVIEKFVQWLRFGEKKLKTFLQYFEDAVKEFLHNFIQELKNAGMAVGNMLIESLSKTIVGPILQIFMRVWSFLKQGASTLKGAIDFLMDPNHRKMPLEELMLEVGKLIIVGVSATGAIALGQVITTALTGFPVFAIDIPILGSPASIIGMLMGGLVTGIIGGIALNKINHMIAERQRDAITQQMIEKNNEILQTQIKKSGVIDQEVDQSRESMVTTIQDNHRVFNEFMEASLHEIFDGEEVKGMEVEVDHSDDFAQMDKDLEELLKGI